MGAAIGDILGLAAGVAVSPLPIVAMILLLATPRGRANGILFGVGWLVGLAVLGAVVLALAGPADASAGGEPAAWTGWLKLLLGVLALLLALRQWRARPAEGAEPEMPRWEENAARPLDTWKTWAATHNAAVMAVLFMVFGLKLVGDGIAVLL